MSTAAGAGRSVLITGTSTGIGRATVDALVDAGFAVTATVRREEDRAELIAAHGNAVTVLLMDLTDEASVRAVGERVVAAGPLFAVVNNAGAALPGPLEFLPIDVFRRQLEINLTGQLLVTQVVLPALRAGAAAGGEAKIVLIGSIGGRIAAPILGAYQAAKHGLVGLAGALRAELAPSNIKVILIEPGSIATPIWDRGQASGQTLYAENPAVERVYGAQLKQSRAMAERGSRSGLPPARAAAAILDALLSNNPAPRRVIGRDAKIIAALVRLLPFRAVYRITRGR